MQVPNKAIGLEARQAEEVTGAAAEHTRRVTCARVPNPETRRQERDQPRLGLDSVHANSKHATSGGDWSFGWQPVETARRRD
jgi:hypothetical protein